MSSKIILSSSLETFAFLNFCLARKKLEIFPPDILLHVLKEKLFKKKKFQRKKKELDSGKLGGGGATNVQDTVSKFPLLYLMYFGQNRYCCYSIDNIYYR